jgi:hypothetical protein
MTSRRQILLRRVGALYRRAVLADAPVGFWRLSEAVPATLVADTFDRADSALSLGTASDGGAWTVGDSGDAATLPTYGIASNKAYLAAPGTQNDPYAWRDAGAADCVVVVDVGVGTSASGSASGLLVRRADSSNYFWIDLYNQGDQVRIGRNLAGVRSIVASTALTIADAQTIRLRVELSGSTFRVYCDGVLKITYTDTNSQAATKHGLYTVNATAAATPTWDNFSITALPDSAADASGNGNTGTYVGGVTLAQPGAYRVGGTAALFDGTSGYVTVPHSASLNLTSGVMSVEVWAKFTSAVNAQRYFCEKNGATAPQLYFLRESNGLLTFGYNDGAAYHDHTQAWTPTAGAWHHLVVTADGSGVRFYVDGAQVGTTKAQSGTPQSAGAGNVLIIGANRSHNGGFFLGSLDVATIYPTTLSLARIQAHYAAAVRG